MARNPRGASAAGTANAANAASSSHQPPAVTTGAASGPTVTIHSAPNIDVFFIREDQLAMLEAGKRDNLVEFGWAMAALAAGAMPSAVPALWRAYFAEPAVPMGPVDQLQFSMVIVGLAAGLVALVVIKSRRTISTDVGTQVRSQKKTP